MVRALMLLLGLAGCASSSSQPVALAGVPSELRGKAPEQAVTLLPLSGPLQSEKAELSGLTWYGDHLVMLPQYPDWEHDGPPCLYTVAKADILARLDHTASGPLEPRCIVFDSGGLEKRISSFEGYEAIGFTGDQAYLTVETHQRTGRGLVVTGRIAPDLSMLKLEASPEVSLPLHADVSNAGFEALVVSEDRVLALYEANGARANPAPAAESLARSLADARKLTLPAIEYRTTDATSLDSEGRFWVMNYSFPATQHHFKPAPDPLMARYGIGPTHAQKPQVERLIELQVKPEGIVLTDRPPIQLQLVEVPRNWEGLVRLDDRGFLLVTDKFPGTLLGFVPGP
ncbi:MAG TPA: hypothetical protein VNA24_15270 [Hyalangium sp.]|nr:hypothetical protein [Hyalangium sp.]